MTGARPRGHRPDPQAWLELLRVSALLTVPGDALAGAAPLAARPNRGTALALASSLCLYEAGMALNDWADRAEDARDRPHRPIPSGRIAPGTALTAACGLTAAGLFLASRAGRPTLAVASAVTATVWAYDLKLKHTALAPATMATARALDLLMGAVATGSEAGGAKSHRSGRAAAPSAGGRAALPAGSSAVLSAAARPAGPCAVPAVLPAARPAAVLSALPAAVLLGVHAYGVTEVSRHEVQGGSTAVPLLALGAVIATAVGVCRGRPKAAGGPPDRAQAGTGAWEGRRPPTALSAASGRPEAPPFARGRLVAGALAAAYLRTAGRPLLHAALNPSPFLTQRAVGGGLRAMIPLQAALAARSGATGTGAAMLALAPLARRLARKVSPT